MTTLLTRRPLSAAAVDPASTAALTAATSPVMRGIALAAESEGHADVKELHVGSLDGGIGRHHDGGGGEGFDDAERAAFRDARGTGEGADHIRWSWG